MTELNKLLIQDLSLETQLLKSFYLEYQQVNTEHVFELLETFATIQKRYLN